MSAADEIQAAIEKLTLQRDLANPGPWMHLDSGDVVMGDRADPVAAYPMVAECAHLNDADLIESLQATIDAQLAILSDGLRYSVADPYTLRLARAINGAAS